MRQITPEMKAHFDPLIKAMGNWHDNIFAYFDHPITNAYTESLNNLTHVMNRVGRGYSFEALRAKILLAEGFTDNLPHSEVAEADLLANYGVDMSILAQEIEAGHF